MFYYQNQRFFLENYLGVNLFCLLFTAKMKKNRMASRKYKPPHLLHHFFLPYWQLSNQWHMMMRRKPGVAMSIKCCLIQMVHVLCIHFMSSQDCFRSVNGHCVAVCLISIPSAFKIILSLRSCRVLVAKSLRKQIKSRPKEPRNTKQNYVGERMVYVHSLLFHGISASIVPDREILLSGREGRGGKLFGISCKLLVQVVFLSFLFFFLNITQALF